MTAHAAITINLPRDEVERRWRQQHPDFGDARVTFEDGPGDRGTEVHVEFEREGGKLGGLLGKLKGSERLAKVKDELRRFKQLVETGEIARSDAAPEGELAERKLKQRPAQPLEDSELEEVGAR